MKKLSIRSLAATSAFLLLVVSSVSACGQQAHKSPSGPGAALQQSTASDGDELQRWEARYPNVRR
jgi:hypothetical protein